MGKKEVKLDKNGIQLTMRQKDLWGYGVGVLGLATITGIIGQITYFYTDKVGLAAGLAGSALMVTKIADGLSDLIMGHIVDRTNTKWGKARPYLLWMIIPMILAVASLLLVPEGLEQTGKFIYAIVSNIFASAIIATAISVPFNCLLNFRTHSQQERTGMNIRRTVMNYLTGMFFSIGFIPLTNALGGTQAAWIKVSLVVAAVAGLCMFISFRSTKEMHHEKIRSRESQVPFFQGIKSLLKNRYWIIMVIAQLVANVVYALSGSTNIYYARWIFGDESIVGVMGAIAFLPTLLGFVLVGPLVKKFGPIKVVQIAFLVGIVGVIGRTLLPRNFIAVCLFGACMSMATIPFMMVAMVLVSNVADFEEWRTGKKIVGLVNSASSFGAKVGSGFGSGLLGAILSFGGYQAMAATQSESAITSIFAISIWIPGAMLVLLLILMSMYDLDKKYPNYRKELMERRAEDNTN